MSRRGRPARASRARTRMRPLKSPPPSPIFSTGLALASGPGTTMVGSAVVTQREYALLLASIGGCFGLAGIGQFQADYVVVVGGFRTTAIVVVSYGYFFYRRPVLRCYRQL